jgi:hypothetical protein
MNVEKLPCRWGGKIPASSTLQFAITVIEKKILVFQNFKVSKIYSGKPLIFVNQYR